MIKKRYRSRKKNKRQYKIILLFFLIVAFIIGTVVLYQRYSFTKEKVNLDTYIGVTGDDVIIYINDIKQQEEDTNKLYTALSRNNQVYLPLSFVKQKLNNRFYYAKDVNKILYCLTTEVLSYGQSDIHQVGNAPYVINLDEPYLLIDFVKDHTNIYYDKYTDTNNKRVYIYTDWKQQNIAYISNNESLRISGGNKSLVITDCLKGDEVKILDKMTKWAKIKTSDGYIGYIRNTRMKNEIVKTPKSTFNEEIRPRKQEDKKLVLAYHLLTSRFRDKSFQEVVKNAKNDLDVLIPTWYSIRSDDGDIRSIASPEYVQSAQKKGYKVWGLLDNFGVTRNIDEKVIFSNILTRKKMIEKILREISVSNLDGINLDIEELKPNEGEDYIQFVRELSIELLKIDKTLSVDIHVPYKYNSHYDLTELNYFCDYVIVMAYDEHYAGSKTSGSVASLPFVKEAIELSLDKVDKDKLILAVPFYTRVWFTDKDGKVTSEAVDPETADNSCKNRGLTTVYDEITGQNYASIVRNDGSKVECWLEDDVSLKNKTKLAKEYDLAGTAAWKITFEKNNFFKIINMNNES